MTTHYLKIEQRWYDRIVNNEKTAEVRLDDRDFQTGDSVYFRDPSADWRGTRRTISHVLREADGLASGYVVLSLTDPRVDDLRKQVNRYWESITQLTNRNRGLRGAITRLQREAAKR